jgi:hypothetical protein
MVKSGQKCVLGCGGSREIDLNKDTKEEPLLEALQLLGVFFAYQGRMGETSQMYKWALRGQE